MTSSISVTNYKPSIGFNNQKTNLGFKGLGFILLFIVLKFEYFALCEEDIEVSEIIRRNDYSEMFMLIIEYERHIT